MRVVCMAQPAPFKQFIMEWALLASAFGQTDVTSYIVDTLHGNIVYEDDWIAFKSVKIAGEHSATIKSVSSNANFVWFSCHQKEDYCYLRDCPGKYFSSTDCNGEKFKIFKGHVGSNSPLGDGDRVGIMSSNENWLSIYKGSACRYKPVST